MTHHDLEHDDTAPDFDGGPCNGCGVCLRCTLVDFFTHEVPIKAPLEFPAGRIWWERCDGWEYPWRVVRPGYGYPSGEPRKVVTK